MFRMKILVLRAQNDIHYITHIYNVHKKYTAVKRTFAEASLISYIVKWKVRHMQRNCI